ncbi:MAG: PrsW family intramembrane metalloprotease [Oscillospiraceae bacterium]|nr:PrsW family intramembrane metalloprotease [Oscillospiraceae bacterium]
MSDIPYHFLSGFIALTVPLLFVAVLLDKGDTRRIILYFCWGTFASVLSFNLNNFFGLSLLQSARMTTSVAPVVEEICKGLPVLLFLNRKKYPHINKTIVLCAMSSGVGFSVLETMYYFSTSSREVSDLLALVVRVLTTSLMHCTVTAIFGIGLLLLQRQRQMIVPIIFGLTALCTSLHALFNLLLDTRLAILALIMPVVLFLGCWMVMSKTNSVNRGIVEEEDD